MRTIIARSRVATSIRHRTDGFAPYLAWLSSPLADSGMGRMRASSLRPGRPAPYLTGGPMQPSTCGRDLDT